MLARRSTTIAALCILIASVTTTHAAAPAGAIISNARDMAKWIRLLLADGKWSGRQLISSGSLRETHSEQVEIGAGISYCLGWMLQKQAGRRLVQHGGNIDGFAAVVALSPDENIGFVLLANVTATPLQNEAMHLVFGTLLPPAQTQAAATGPADLHSYVGKYIADFGPFKQARFAVTAKKGTLFVDVPGQMKYELKPPGLDGRWPFAMTDAIAVSFNRDKAGRVYSMLLYQSGYRFELPKEGRELPIEIPLDKLRKYVGRYHGEAMKSSDPMKMNLTVAIHNNRLTVRAPGQMRVELCPPDEKGQWHSRIKEGLLRVTFEQKPDGSVSTLALVQGGLTYKLARVAGASQPALPTVDELMALIRKGYGAEHLDAIRNMRSVATVDLVHQGVRATITTTVAGTDRLRIHTDFGKFGHATVVLNGKRGWVESAFHPFEELTGRRLRHALAQHPTAFLKDWREVCDTIRILRTEMVYAEKVYVADLIKADAPTRTLHVSAETGLILKMESVEIAKGITEVPVDVRYSDFRSVDGLQMAFRTTLDNPISGRMIVELEKVQTNIDLPADTFVLKPPAQKKIGTP